MTATEVMERQAEKAAVLGTLIGRIASDFLDPIIRTMFAYAMRAGRIPPPPQTLAVWMAQNGHRKGTLKIEYIGPLAQAQRKFHVTQGTTQALNAILPYAQFHPQILDIFNWDEIAREIAESHGMPARLILSEDLLQQLRQAKAEAEQRAAEMAQQQQGADMYQKLKDAPQEGSPVTEIGQQLAAAVGAGVAPGAAA
jgi:hypothetical protein